MPATSKGKKKPSRQSTRNGKKQSRKSRKTKSKTVLAGNQSPGTAKKMVVPASASLDAIEWESWVGHLQTTTKTVAAFSLFAPAKESPLLWGYPAVAGDEEDGTASLIQKLHKAARHAAKGKKAKYVTTALANWLESASEPDATTHALEYLAVAYALAPCAAQIGQPLWRQLLEFLQTSAQDAAGIPLEDQPWRQQLLGAELAITLAAVFPSLQDCAALRGAGISTMRAGMSQLLDGNGYPAARFFHLLRPLLASWTRAATVADVAGFDVFEKETRLQFEWVVRQAVRHSRSDGTACFVPHEQSNWQPGLFAAALAISGDENDAAAAAKALPKTKLLPRNKHALLPESADRSEWSHVATLRTNWKRNATSLTVQFDKPAMQVEVNAAGSTFLCGQWDFSLQANGQTLAPASSWSEVCWHTDDDVDYLELELELENGWRVQRSLLLAREDGFLFLADALLHDSAQQYEYQSRLPLAAGTKYAAEKQTNEGFLQSGDASALVMPLALPEWRDDVNKGSLAADGAGLKLSQHGYASNVFTPLVFDFGATATSAYTWRKLTVASQLEIVHDDVAVGYRARRNALQWAFYRSLAKPANRTVLGENIICEFFAIKLEDDGSTHEIISVG